MTLERIRQAVCRHAEGVVVAWFVAAALVAWAAPSLTRLAAEGQANLLPKDAESVRVAEEVARAWPDQAYQSIAVVALQRSGPLTPDDRAFALRLSERFLAPDRPREVLRVLGPASDPEVARRLVSRDKTMQLVAVPLAASFVSPSAHRAVAWLQARAETLARARPAGLTVLWTGDAVIGRDYMSDVQRSLNRAALATVFLLLIVLLTVYRSVFLALVPLVTIGVSLVISRGVLAWLVTAGWEVSPLVELFLVVLLFGSGTDFCLFLTWRFDEHWQGTDPVGTMTATLRNGGAALITSAATVIAGLSLMGLTRFKLFSSTGPSVALGLALTLMAALTLTPALLVLLARYRPRCFKGMHAASSAFWDRIAHRTLKRPLLTWLVTLGLIAPAAVIGLRTVYTQDILTEMSGKTASVQALRAVSGKFGEGFLTPLTVVITAESPDDDLKQSEGLALIDDASRFLSQNRRLLEVRSATQPLGSTVLLDPARLSARLGAIDHGFGQMADGARQLQDGLVRGVAKIRLAMMLDSLVHGNLSGLAASLSATALRPAAPSPPKSSKPLVSTVQETATTLGGTQSHVAGAAARAKPAVDPARESDPRAAMIRELTQAADGAGRIADGARSAREEVGEILNDPVGRHSLDRLLITPETVRAHPELLQSFASYISRDGKQTRIDVIQDERMNSEAAMDQVVNLRRRLGEYLAEARGPRVRAGFTGSNADAADIRSLTRSDQQRTWLIVPAGVFLILLITLRDPWACLNLVATMLLTYAFALGITHLVFVTGLGDAGLDWKVPYFLFVLLVAVGVDYNVFLMTRLHEEVRSRGLRLGITRAVAATGGLISSAALITACSFASLLLSPLASLRQLGFALVVGITVDAVLVRPVLVPCGHWLMKFGWGREFPATASTPSVEDLAPASG